MIDFCKNFFNYNQIHIWWYILIYFLLDILIIIILIGMSNDYEKKRSALTVSTASIDAYSDELKRIENKNEI